jgi:Zn finger protein HypA/HybF involved in hydrogenase expression
MTHRSDPKLNREIKCEKCGTLEGLEFHHEKYEPQEKVYLDDLRILCTKCHRNDNENVKRSNLRTVYEDGKRYCETTIYRFEY